MSIERRDDYEPACRPLDEIERDLAEKQQEFKFQWTRTLDVAVEIGDVLIEAKQQVPHGEWLKWLGDHFEGSVRQAQRIMQAAANATKLTHLGPGATLHDGLDAITEPKQAKQLPPATKGDPITELVAAAHVLRAALDSLEEDGQTVAVPIWTLQTVARAIIAKLTAKKRGKWQPSRDEWREFERALEAWRTIAEEGLASINAGNVGPLNRTVAAAQQRAAKRVVGSAGASASVPAWAVRALVL